MTSPRRCKSRSGFTLTELLVAITVMAILVGMLAAAIIPVMATANRTAVLMEMKQIEQSIENFKNQYGIYPPSFVKFHAQAAATNDNDAATLLLKYVNGIAPNNREGVGAVGSRPIDAWWLAIGKNINQAEGQDLVFWLSGLSKNKQYPLTNDGATLPNAFNDETFERDVFYEFKNAQLEIDGVAASYMQQPNVVAPFLYIDAKSYGIDVGGYDGYHVLNQVPTNSKPDYRSYENPKSFQLISWGLDKDPGNSPSGNPTQWARQISNMPPNTGYDGLDQFANAAASDNLCNFCDGMLERFIEGGFDSAAVEK